MLRNARTWVGAILCLLVLVNHAHAELIDVEAERDVGFATKGAVTLGLDLNLNRTKESARLGALAADSATSKVGNASVSLGYTTVSNSVVAFETGIQIGWYGQDTALGESGVLGLGLSQRLFFTSHADQHFFPFLRVAVRLIDGSGDQPFEGEGENGFTGSGRVGYDITGTGYDLAVGFINSIGEDHGGFVQTSIGYNVANTEQTNDLDPTVIDRTTKNLQLNAGIGLFF